MKKVLGYSFYTFIITLVLSIIIALLYSSNAIATTNDEDEEEGEAQSEQLVSMQSIEWIKYNNSAYGVSLEYPSIWKPIEGDITPGDFVTNIVTFQAPFDEEPIIKGEKNERNQFISLMIYHPPSYLETTQHNLDIYLESQLNSYLGDHEDVEMIGYSSQNLTLGGKGHPAFSVHLRFEEDNFDYEHTIISTSKIV